ncbi:MAG: hypothetical protein IPM68_19435 [Flavobacteriales bacterium]|nr:hypothetical protein [Flavobacteriales bacterium]
MTFGNAQSYTWSGGTLAGAGGFTVAIGSSLVVNNAAKTLNTTLTNNGTMAWSAGGISGSGSIRTTLGHLQHLHLGVNILSANSTNAGTINYSGTGGFNQLNSNTYSSSGTLNITSGIWDNYGNQTLTGTTNISSGAALRAQTGFSMSGIVSNTGTITGSTITYTGPTITNNGSVTLTNLPFAGTAAQALNGTGTISNLTIDNPNGVTLGGMQTVSNTLTLTSGRITLGNNDLITLNSALAGLGGTLNAANQIVTNGTGAFHRQLAAGGSNYPFPIGTGASYLPVTLSNTSGPVERFGARVQNDVHSDYSTPGVPAGQVVVNDQVERTWVITEQTEGGNQATVQLQWNGADEGANFNRANSGLHSYNGSDWVALALGAAGGSNPYTRNATNVGVFREFTVADGESTLPFVCNNGLVPGAACNDNDACTINDAVNASCVCVGTFQDTDNDGTCNANDGCPNDANKVAPGVCGCGVADVAVTYYADVDGDGFGDPNGAQQAGYSCIVPPGFVANNTDQCPSDPLKQAPGGCGCGVADVAVNYYADADGDGFGAGAAIPGFTCTVPPGTVLNNTDACPNDPLKQTAGACGCGNLETDSDGDGTPNCNDGCPNDPLKTAPGSCGCGFPDQDLDNNGLCDNAGACTAYIAPAVGGVGGPAITITPACPPSNVGLVDISVCTNTNSWVKLFDAVTNTLIDLGAMNGCGATGNGCPGGGLNCLYDSWSLPAGSYKLNFYLDAFAANAIPCATIPFSVPGPAACCGGLGPVGSPCDDDDPCTINDTVVSDCSCLGTFEDTDEDNVCNAEDGCPNDPLKIAPGICGCGVSDADTDGDLTADCNDGCPNDPLKMRPGICGCGVADTDTDSDLTADCNDGCPLDQVKGRPGICGCGVSDADTDGDLTADCNDGCPLDH